MTHTPERRAAYIKGLRHLADALESNEQMPLPYEGTNAEISFFCHSREELAELIQMLPGQKSKHIDGADPTYGFRVSATTHGLRWTAFVDRDEVCTARVVGTETVTRQVPTDYKEVTEQREVIEWDCHPVLGGVR